MIADGTCNCECARGDPYPQITQITQIENRTIGVQTLSRAPCRWQLKRRGSYFAIGAGLGVLAIIAYLAWLRPFSDEFVMPRPPFSGSADRGTTPVAIANFPTLPPVSKSQLVSGTYEAQADVNLLPDALKEFYGIGTDNPASGMANPGHEFNVTDVILNHKLPRKRLVFAAVRRPEMSWIVHFEYGGFAHGYEVHFLIASANSVEPVWRCYLDQPATDMQALQSKILGGECKVPG